MNHILTLAIATMACCTPMLYSDPDYQDERVAITAWKPKEKSGVVSANMTQTNPYFAPIYAPSESEVGTAKRIMFARCRTKYEVDDEGVVVTGDSTSSGSALGSAGSGMFGTYGVTQRREGKQYNWSFHCVIDEQ